MDASEPVATLAGSVFGGSTRKTGSTFGGSCFGASTFGGSCFGGSTFGGSCFGASTTGSGFGASTRGAGACDAWAMTGPSLVDQAANCPPPFTATRISLSDCDRE